MYYNNNLPSIPGGYNNVMFQRELELYTYREKKHIDTEAEVWKNKMKYEQKAQQEALREMKKQNITINSLNEAVIVQTTANGSVKRTALPIKIIDSILYTSLAEKADSRVLNLIINNQPKQEISLWIANESMIEKNLKTIYQRSGIILGYGAKKEAEIFRGLIIAASQSSRLLPIPPEHGWYKTDDGFKYAFPDALTWKKVLQNAEQYFK